MHASKKARLTSGDRSGQAASKKASATFRQRKMEKVALLPCRIRERCLATRPSIRKRIPADCGLQMCGVGYGWLGQRLLVCSH